MEYRSKKSFLGLSLAHIQESTYREGRRQIGIAKGWIMAHFLWILVPVLTLIVIGKARGKRAVK